MELVDILQKVAYVVVFGAIFISIGSKFWPEISKVGGWLKKLREQRKENKENKEDNDGRIQGKV